MKLFKSRKERSGFIPKMFLPVQIFINDKALRLAQYINRKFQTIHRRSLYIGFAIAGCAWCFACWFVATASFSATTGAVKISSVHTPVLPKNITDSMDGKRLKIALQHIAFVKRYLDSLEQNEPAQYGKLMMDRPGLDDSMAAVEKLYQGH